MEGEEGKIRSRVWRKGGKGKGKVDNGRSDEKRRGERGRQGVWVGESVENELKWEKGKGWN